MSPGRSPLLAAGDPGSTAVMNSGGSASCGAVSASGGAGDVMIPRSPGISPGGGAGYDHRAWLLSRLAIMPVMVAAASCCRYAGLAGNWLVTFW